MKLLRTDSVVKKISVAFVCVAALSSCATMPANQVVSSDARLEAGVFGAVKIDEFESRSFVSSRGTALQYRVLRPRGEVPGRAYPLVVQLHGSGGIGTDNVKQMELLARSWAMHDVRERYPAFVLIPQFPVRSANYGPRTPDQHAVASPALDDALELVREFAASNAVDTSRIYATGFSMGGSTAWLLAQHAPEIFAAIVPFGGVAPPDDQAARFVGVPVLAIHGNADTENPITADRRFVAAIRAAGGRHATLREYEGLVHSPPADAYPGFWWRDWMFAQRKK